MTWFRLHLQRPAEALDVHADSLADAGDGRLGAGVRVWDYERLSPLVLWQAPCESFHDAWRRYCVVDVAGLVAVMARREVHDAFVAGRAARTAFDLLDGRGEQRAYCFVRSVLYGEMEFEYVVACGVALYLTRPVNSWWERSWETHDRT